MLLLAMVMIVLVEERKGPPWKGPPWKGTHGHRVNRKPELRLGELNFGMQRRQISAQKNLMEIEEGEQLDRIPVCTTVSIPVRQMLAYSAEESLSLPLPACKKRHTVGLQPVALCSSTKAAVLCQNFWPGTLLTSNKQGCWCQ